MVAADLDRDDDANDVDRRLGVRERRGGRRSRGGRVDRGRGRQRQGSRDRPGGRRVGDGGDRPEPVGAANDDVGAGVTGPARVPARVVIACGPRRRHDRVEHEDEPGVREGHGRGDRSRGHDDLG